jgi:hypothetical protein
LPASKLVKRERGATHPSHPKRCAPRFLLLQSLMFLTTLALTSFAVLYSIGSILSLARCVGVEPYTASCCLHAAGVQKGRPIHHRSRHLSTSVGGMCMPVSWTLVPAAVGRPLSHLLNPEPDFV